MKKWKVLCGFCQQFASNFLMNDLLYQIALTRIPLVGAVTARTLVSYCGSVEGIFTAKKKNLLKIPGIGERLAENIISTDVLREAEREMRFIEKNQIQVLFYLDDKYPDKLKHYADSPILLFYKGNADLNNLRVVAIVGTRQPTPQGIAFCEDLVADLKPYNVLILSGLAYGIDVTAHRKSVELDIPTVGALGHGFQTIYPSQHRSIAERMCEKGGLLTEFPSNTLPDREHFPMRNKIIAGLCDALVVVETAKKGGSMITAHLANEYNKDVFAVPGRLQDKYAQGCNYLIKTHKAALLESAADLAYVMRWEAQETPKLIQRQLFVELSADEKLVVNLLQQYPEANIDRLLYETQMTGSALAAQLLELEFKGVVKSLPGKRYTLIQQPN